MKTLLNILSWTGLLIWCAFFTLGYNYRQGGGLLTSIIIGVLLFVIMGVLLYLMKRWSHPDGNDNMANAKSKELISAGLFAVTLLCSASGVARFITVQTDVKNQVRPLAEERIEELRTVFGDESLTGSYKNYIDMKSGSFMLEKKAELRRQGYNMEDAEKSAQTAKTRMIEDITDEGAFEDQRSKVLRFCDDLDWSVSYWVPWYLPKDFADLDTNLPKWEEEVVKMSKKNSWTVNEPYSIESKATEKIANLISTPKDGIFSGKAVILMIVLVIVIVLSYLAGRNWGIGGPKKFRGDGITTWS